VRKPQKDYADLNRDRGCLGGSNWEKRRRGKKLNSRNPLRKPLSRKKEVVKYMQGSN